MPRFGIPRANTGDSSNLSSDFQYASERSEGGTSSDVSGFAPSVVAAGGVTTTPSSTMKGQSVIATGQGQGVGGGNNNDRTTVVGPSGTTGGVDGGNNNNSSSRRGGGNGGERSRRYGKQKGSITSGISTLFRRQPSPDFDESQFLGGMMAGTTTNNRDPTGAYAGSIARPASATNVGSDASSAAWTSVGDNTTVTSSGQSSRMMGIPKRMKSPSNRGRSKGGSTPSRSRPNSRSNSRSNTPIGRSGNNGNDQQQQQQQPLQPNMQPFNPNNGSMMSMPNHTKLASPPISPLWTPASPDQSPEDQNKMRQQTTNKNMMPTLPSSFAPAPVAGAPVPTLSPTPAANPFDVFGGNGGSSSSAAHPVPQVVAPSQAIPNDPFGDNGAAPTTPGASVPQPNQQQQQQQQTTTQQDEADFWSDMGFGNAPPPAGNVTPTSNNSDASVASASTAGDEPSPYNLQNDGLPVTLDERGLPVGGEYYKARVTTPMLGAIFSSAKELRSTLYKTASDSFVEAIGERPVISFTIDGSAADTAGIGLGHVLLKVNDQEVRQTDEAVKTVGAAARPMIMEFYMPNKAVKVVKTEGQCMVKYDNHSTEAPASACEWKPKYVVVGDMLGKPHILYMYRSKAEYDIAVRESQTRNRSLSVKVKQFDIRGAKIFHERGTVQYPNKPKWHYFTVVRGTGLPIKISARMPEDLHPVYEGIVGFLDREMRVKKMRMEQSRERMHMTGMYRETYY
mmetsp:Transcript_1577/g.3436  ORF Transcript_1577/g.3436 Transcript_1577/m.3436 type:complete len:734 (-) Transcript_1577:365-2566(-)